ncbi:MAG: hypothetical protein H6618_10310 [Deltaproteobacteria bacterium]|nr:hypothetical protein [Deltaproteobacteria bacterium]
MLTHDFHVHLYGCLSAERLWNFGKDLYKKRTTALDWYASEYQKAWGKKPDYIRYWESQDGILLLKDDFLFRSPDSFDRFQANFNLIIALCQISTSDFSIPEQIIRDVQSSGLSYFEARTLISPRFDHAEAYDYLKGLCHLIRRMNQEGGMTTKLVFSLFRDQKLAHLHYDWIRLFTERHRDLAEEIVGIDVAGKEEGNPPAENILLFDKIRKDNRKGKRLGLFYHVGESFEDKGIISGIRWVYEAHELLKVDRLGHATALGVHPENYRDKVVAEPTEERFATLNWLLEQQEVLALHGYRPDVRKIRHELEALANGSVRIVYDQDYIDEALLIQRAVLSLLKSRDAVVESCPTSNLRIAQLRSEQYHPVRHFKKYGLKFVLGTDDPGIFNTDWKTESELADRL